MKNIVKEAFLFALKVHENQFRKDGKPYILHPFSVALVLSKAGAKDELICAGLLHDTIEDGGVTKEEIEEKFGSEVLKYVLFDTENKQLPWKERKSVTLNALKSSDISFLMLVCADKLSNIEDFLEGLNKYGDEFFNNFKYGKTEQSWLYHEYVKELKRLEGLEMYEDFKQTVEKVFTKGDNN